MVDRGDDSIYREYFERSPIGVFVVNGAGAYVDVNETACEMVGYSREELLSMSIPDLVGSDTAAEIGSFAAVKARGRVRDETRLVRASGEAIDVLLDAAQIDDDRYVAYVKDITKRKRAERKLESQRDELEVLNKILRHDVRNDLQLVTAYVDLIAERVTDEQVAAYLQTVSSSAEHAVELTQTAGEMADVLLLDDDATRPTHLPVVLVSEIDAVRESFPGAEVVLETDIPAVDVRANELLGSVFRNLLKNAVQHNDTDAPVVTVEARRTDAGVTVRFADDGPGIPDRLKAAVTRDGFCGEQSGGSGVGLYLVSTLAENYGGDLYIEDNEPRGTVVSVELPIAG
jgi:PAS domain S-box-containing protein